MTEMNSLELHAFNEAGELVFRDGDQPCPGCGCTVTFTTLNEGLSVDVLHPQPGCDAFRAFVARLQAAFEKQSALHS